jgi:DNA-binding Xre family transcriptional regulator
MMTHPEGDELLRKQVQRLENQLAAVIYLTKAAISILKRMAAGESVPIEQIESIDKAIDTLSPGRRR